MCFHYCVLSKVYSFHAYNIIIDVVIIITIGQISFESADNGHEQEIPNIPGMDHDQELKVEVITGEHGASFVTWAEGKSDHLFFASHHIVEFCIYY